MRPAVLGVVLLVGIALAAVLGLASWHAVRAAGELRALERSLPTDLAGREQDAATDAVAAARGRARRAHAHLTSPSVAVATRLPVIGGTLSAARASSGAATSVLDAGHTALAAVPTLRTGDRVDADALSALAVRLQRFSGTAERDLRHLEAVVAERWVPPQLRPELDRAHDALVDAVDGLRTGADATALAAGLLGSDGSREVLVALGNNAELRGTGGYVSTFAQGTVAGGRLVLEPFRDVEDVADPAPAARPVPAPAEFVEDFAPYRAHTTLWREWTMTPDVPDAASVASQALGVLTGRRPDVVVLLDVPALAALVELAGQQVRLASGVVAPDRLTEMLLVDTYAAAGATVAEQDERRARLRAAAGEAAADVLSSDVGVLAAGRELARLARARHLAVWSARPDEQAALERFGLAGSANPGPDDLALVTANNLNANKLDYYVDRSVSVDATVHADHVDVVQQVVLRNRAPEGLVPYVAGARTPGTVVERVELSLAPDVDLVSVEEDGGPASGGVHRGGERTRVHAFVELARGQQAELTVRYTRPRLAGADYRLRLVPQALARPAELDVAVRPAAGLRLTGAGDEGLVRRSGPWRELEVVQVGTEPASQRVAQ